MEGISLNEKIVNEVVIIIVNYNGNEDTYDCLKSLSNLKNLPSVIVVDNGSNEPINQQISSKLYPDLHIIYNKKNIGFGRGNNLGIKWALENIDFKYLCLLNNDTTVSKDFIDHLKTPFLEDASVGITSGKIYYANDKNKVWYGGGDINYLRCWPRITDFNKPASENGANKPKYVSFISGCLMMFSRESIKKIKGFDEDIFMYCEDLELSIRALKKDLRLFYNPLSVIYHKVHGSSKNNKSSSKSSKKTSDYKLSFLFYHMKINQYKIINKHFKGSKLIISIFYYWFEFSIRVIINLIQGRLEIIKVGKKIILKNIK